MFSEFLFSLTYFAENEQNSGESEVDEDDLIPEIILDPTATNIPSIQFILEFLLMSDRSRSQS
jgi:hypothetical protein